MHEESKKCIDEGFALLRQDLWQKMTQHVQPVMPDRFAVNDTWSL